MHPDEILPHLRHTDAMNTPNRAEIGYGDTMNVDMYASDRQLALVAHAPAAEHLMATDTEKLPDDAGLDSDLTEFDSDMDEDAVFGVSLPPRTVLELTKVQLEH